MVISLSFMMSTSIIVGRYIGAGKTEKAEAVTKSVAKISFIVLTVIGLITFVFSEDIARLFTPNDFEVLKQSAEYIKIMSLFFGFVGLQQIFNGTFIGAGDTPTSMALSFFSFWVLRIPVAFVLSHWLSWGFLGICWSLPVANVAASLAGYLVFVSGRWKERSLKH
jgi:Na+-driven multidrug efflux pump